MTGNEMILAVTALTVIFAPLSLVAYLIKKLIINRRKARARRAARIAAYKSIADLAESPVQHPVAPRVLYVPKREEEHEADVVVPSAWVLNPFFTTGDLSTKSLPEEFVGKGGQSGGAGASAEWEAPASERPATVAETPAEPEPVSTFETSETTIAEPEVTSPSES